MPDTDPPKDQLIAELAALRQRVMELETAQAAHAQERPTKTQRP